MRIGKEIKHVPVVTFQPVGHKNRAKVKGIEGEALGDGSFKVVRALHVFNKHRKIDSTCALALARKGSEQELKHECSVAKKLKKRHISHVVSMKLVNCKRPNRKKRLGALMPLYSGGDLCSYLAKHPDLSPLRRIQLADELVQALQGIHENGLCHLDLKEENIFVDEQSEGRPHLVLGDFGETKKIGKLIFPCGTFPAPEMHEMDLKKRKIRVQPALDLWPLGSILMNVLHQIGPLRTGDLSWGAELKRQEFQDGALAVSLQAEELAFKTHDQPDQVVAQLLSLAPEERPSAAKVHEIFQRWLRTH